VTQKIEDKPYQRYSYTAIERYAFTHSTGERVAGIYIARCYF